MVIFHNKLLVYQRVIHLFTMIYLSHQITILYILPIPYGNGLMAISLHWYTMHDESSISIADS